MRIIHNSKGEFTLNGALILLLVMLVIVLAISILGIGVQSMKLHSAGKELTRYIEVRGKVDDSVYTEFDRLKTELGQDVDFSVDADYLSASDKTIQFGNAFTVTLTEQVSFGAGGVLKIPITLHSSSPGRSEQYWKH